MSTPFIIYDGECQLCQTCLDWLCMKAEVEALSYHDARLSEYGLTKERCEREVVVLAEGQTIGGATGIAYLLNLRGNHISAFVIKTMGPVSRVGYRWVASHRDSRLIGFASRFLKWRIRKRRI